MTIAKFTILSLLALITGCEKPCTVPSSNKQATEFMATPGYQFHGAFCSGLDSDGDGYVTCTARLKEPKDGKDTVDLLCGYPSDAKCTSGCKFK